MELPSAARELTQQGLQDMQALLLGIEGSDKIIPRLLLAVRALDSLTFLCGGKHTGTSQLHHDRGYQSMPMWEFPRLGEGVHLVYTCPAARGDDERPPSEACLRVARVIVRLARQHQPGRQDEAIFRFVSSTPPRFSRMIRGPLRYYAPIQGHELVTRRDLIPSEPDHPRAGTGIMPSILARWSTSCRPSSPIAGDASPSSSPAARFYRTQCATVSCMPPFRGLNGPLRPAGRQFSSSGPD